MITKIVIHCSDSPHFRGDDAQTIHKWHLEKGWDGIGYHLVITESGEVQPGRPWYWQGAHVGPHNPGSLGICLIGRDYFTDEQLESLRYVYDELRAAWPEAEWLNHYDLDPNRTCPNFDAVALLVGA